MRRQANKSNLSARRSKFLLASAGLAVFAFGLYLAPSPFRTLAASLLGDINGDGKVDIFDLSILLSNFGKSVSPQPPPPPSVTPPNPPPTPPPSTGWNPGPEKMDLSFDPGCNFSQWDQVLQELGTATIVHSPVYQGSCAASISQGPNTTGAFHRVELSDYSLSHGSVLTHGGEAWYQWRYYPVSSGTVQGGDGNYIINQFRTTQSSCFTGGTQVHAATNELVYRLLTSACGSTAANIYNLGTITYGNWYLMQYHFIWNPNGAGRAEIWVNGVKKVDYTGPNTASGASTDQIMFRIGIYAGNHSGTHAFVADDVHIYGK